MTNSGEPRRKSAYSILGAIAGGPVYALLVFTGDLEISLLKAAALGWLFSVPVAGLDYLLGEASAWRRLLVSIPAGALLGFVVWLSFDTSFVPVEAWIIGFAVLVPLVREIEYFLEHRIRSQ